jgi:putative ABC transport system permease protein
VDQRGATTDYFRTMRIPLVRGRTFAEADLAQGAAQVALIDEKFANRFWPNGDAVGKHVWFDPKNQIEIVGVVGTVKQYGLDVDGRIVVYRPSLNAGWHVARTSSDPATVGRDLVRKIRELDPTMTVVDVQTMTDRMGASLARQRFATLMLGAFAAFALILAVVGVYGVMSHLVTQGAHDIGVRMALGAERASILLMVLRQGLALTAAGIVIGLLGAFALTTTDVLTFTTVPVVLIATAMLASYIPALRATRVDPVIALRDEG